MQDSLLWQRRWHSASEASDPMQSLDSPQQSAVLRSKAITAALLFDAAKAHDHQDDDSSFALKAQNHLQTIGELDMAGDVSDALKLAKFLAKVGVLLWQLLCRRCR